MTRSEELFERAAKLYPKGVNSPVRFYQPYPLFFKRGIGGKIEDVDGKIYNDFVLAYGPLILGHANPEVIRKVRERIENGTLFGAPVEAEVEFGEIFKKATGIEMMRIVNTGTEATMHAIRLALHVTGRRKVLKIKGGYHGTHPYNYPSEYVNEVEFNDLDSALTKLSTREMGAFIVEPVMGNAGVIPPDDGYLEQIEDACRRYGTPFIVDEVITGFRSGFYPYYKKKGIEPDLATFGKIVGGGFPLAVYGGRERFMKEVRPEGNFPQAGTFSGNPVSITAGLETLRILSKIDYRKLNRLTDLAIGELSRSGLSVNGLTGMLSIFFMEGTVRNYEDVLASRKDLYFRLFRAAIDNGIYVPPSYDETIFISFAHNEKDIKDSFSFLGAEAERLWKSS
ncbi:MAG: aminotransferase class III-fold pyridoxal phosphate-dependent enzyme [Thermoplasmatales archaeon]